MVSSVVVTVGAASFMIHFTDFNILFGRFLGTRFDGVTPDTRRGWPAVMEHIRQKPILGHGPRLVVREEPGVPLTWPKGEIDFYPHSLYLYILYTTGLVGMLAYGTWLLGYLVLLLRKQGGKKNANEFLSGIPRLGIVELLILLFDQLKSERLRADLLDYQHYVAALLGVLLGGKMLARKA
jgi:O-antigen ligase